MTEETQPDTSEEGKEEEESSSDMVDKANLAALRLEEANKKKEELLNREEQLIIKAKLGGKSDAGSVPEDKKEETPAEYAKRVMAGGVIEKP